jgi:hypothetical protein
LLLLGVVVMVFFLSAGGGGSNTKTTTIETKNLRSGQAMHPSTATTTSTTNTTSSTTLGVTEETTKGDVVHEVESLQETLDTAADDVEEAAEDQLEKNEDGLLSKALNSMESVIKASVAKLLGDDASVTAIDELTQEVEGALVSNATEELEQRAEEIGQKETDGIREQVELGSAMGESNGELLQEVHDSEAETLITVRDEVDNAAVDIRQHLRERAAQLEKSIMEKRLSERLGRPIKLAIVDGDVEFAPRDPFVSQQVQQPQYAQQQPGTQQALRGQQPGLPQQGGYAQQPPPQNNGYYLPPPQQGGPQTRYQQPPPQGFYQPPPQGFFPQQSYYPQQEEYGSQPPSQANGQQLNQPLPGRAVPASGYQAPQGDGSYAPPPTIGGVPAFGTPPAVGANGGAPVDHVVMMSEHLSDTEGDEVADDEDGDDDKGGGDAEGEAADGDGVKKGVWDP